MSTYLVPRRIADHQKNPANRFTSGFVFLISRPPGGPAFIERR